MVAGVGSAVGKGVVFVGFLGVGVGSHLAIVRGQSSDMAYVRI